MSLHFVAAGQIALMMIYHLVLGGKSNALRHLNHQREEGKNSLSSRSHIAVYFGCVVFFVGSAILLLLPNVPLWIEIALGGIWVILGVADLALNRAKTSGGYFGLSTGTLILVGNVI